MGIEAVIGVEIMRKNGPNQFSITFSIDSMWHPSPASPLANRNGGEDWRANNLKNSIIMESRG